MNNNLIAIVQIIISIVLIIIGVICIKKLIKWKESKNFNDYSDDGFCFVMGMIGAGSVIALGIVLIIGNTLGIIQNVCMPELTILNYIRNLT